MPNLIISPTDRDIDTALNAFLLTLVPTGYPVIRGQVNRVPVPQVASYTVFWPTRRPRLATNIDNTTQVGATILGFMVADQMIAINVALGVINIGDQVIGSGVIPGTRIISQIADDAWTIAPSQTAGPGLFTIVNAQSVMQETQCDYQIDVHGPGSADIAQIITTLFRDVYATSYFETNYPAISPLYADDAKQLAFVNDSSQFEDRWVIEAVLQADIVVSIVQESALLVEVEIISVDETFPPT